MRWLAYVLVSSWLLGWNLRLLAVLLAVVVLDRLLPGPRALWRALRDAGRLRREVEVNPANVLARRNLARIYLDVKRPRAALRLVEEALARVPNDAELLYLAGLALVRAGRREEALPKLVAAVEADPRVGFGRPYLVAGDALLALGRADGAIDAYERYLSTNGADVAARVRLVRAHAQAGEREAALRALGEARATYRGLPGRHAARSLGCFVAVQWARVTLGREPGPALVALAGLGALACAVLAAPRCASHVKEQAAGVAGEMVLTGYEDELKLALETEIAKVSAVIPVLPPLPPDEAERARREFVALPIGYGAGTSQRFHRALMRTEGAEGLRERFVKTEAERGAGEFLGRLCSLFEPPGEFGTIHFVVLHRPTGIVFTAYSGDSGPSYGGAYLYEGPLPAPEQQREEPTKFVSDEALRPVVERFERLIVSLPLANCAVVQSTDFGLYAFGAQEGQPFERKLTFAEAVDHYTQVIARYGGENDSARYDLAYPEREILGLWVEASEDERKERPAALDSARRAWRRDLDRLVNPRPDEQKDAQSWGLTWSYLEETAPALDLPESDLALLARVKEPPPGP